MIRTVWSLPPDFVARVAALLPRARATDFDRLAIMLGGQVVIRDDGTAHPAFVAWVADILGRDPGSRPGGGTGGDPGGGPGLAPEGTPAIPTAPVSPAPAGASLEVTR